MKARECTGFQSRDPVNLIFKRATVIAKGAILRAMHRDLIGERYLRRSIGIGWDEAFDSNKHNEKDKTIDIHDGAEIVEDCIHWLFKVVRVRDIRKASRL